MIAGFGGAFPSSGFRSMATHYKWRKEYGGLRVDQARRLMELEQENGRLRKVVSDLSIDIAILKEAARGNF
jgi:hypothetical protein